MCFNMQEIFRRRRRFNISKVIWLLFENNKFKIVFLRLWIFILFYQLMGKFLPNKFYVFPSYKGGFCLCVSGFGVPFGEGLSRLKCLTYVIPSVYL